MPRTRTAPPAAGGAAVAGAKPRPGSASPSGGGKPSSIGARLQAKAGPLPVWAWIILGAAAAYLAYRYYQNNSGSAATATTPAAATTAATPVTPDNSGGGSSTSDTPAQQATIAIPTSGSFGTPSPAIAADIAILEPFRVSGAQAQTDLKTIAANPNVVHQTVSAKTAIPDTSGAKNIAAFATAGHGL